MKVHFDITPTNGLFVFATKMDGGHPKHVLQTHNCVFVSQSYFLHVFINSSQCLMNLMGELSLSWKVGFLSYVYISASFNSIGFLFFLKKKTKTI